MAKTTTHEELISLEELSIVLGRKIYSQATVLPGEILVLDGKSFYNVLGVYQRLVYKVSYASKAYIVEAKKDLEAIISFIDPVVLKEYLAKPEPEKVKSIGFGITVTIDLVIEELGLHNQTLIREIMEVYKGKDIVYVLIAELASITIEEAKENIVHIEEDTVSRITNI